MKKEATAFAPASVSNVSCGFDIMGFALEGAGDTVTARLSPNPGVRIGRITGSRSPLPEDASKNTAGPPVLALLCRCDPGTGVELDINKGIPVGGGLGSSAASAVAAVLAADALLGTGLPREELLALAIEGEKIASGAVHVDNLSPCLWGGFILVRGYHPIDIVPLRVPGSLWCAVISPEIEIRTDHARRILPKAVPLQDVITQTGNAAGLVAGMFAGDYRLISRSLRDVIAEPAREHLIPGYARMKEAALAQGALGCGISGSGPSLFAFSASRREAGLIASAMGSVLDAMACPYATLVSPVGAEGARIVS
ncbi:MAG TPA: homoserine kinase [Bacteroidota bacterium]|nr:homoserine kinase [Bacteroidota bacterium]